MNLLFALFEFVSCIIHYLASTYSFWCELSVNDLLASEAIMSLCMGGCGGLVVGFK